MQISNNCLGVTLRYVVSVDVAGPVAEPPSSAAGAALRDDVTRAAVALPVTWR